jgi:hypothetical protein
MNNEIILANVAPEETPAQPNHDNDRSDHALTGKIARLPGDLREQLNQHLLDNQPNSKILPWLNELPAVKEILAAQFGGKPINDTNLTYWRQGGYQRWLRHKQTVNSLKDLGQFAADLTPTGVDRLTPAAVVLASAKILEFLESLNTTAAAQTDPNNLVKCAAAVAVLREKDQNEARIKIAQHRLRQRDALIRLKKDKQQRDAVAIARRVLGDARAAAIEASSWNNAEKIEALGIHLFGHLWEPRPIAEVPKQNLNPSSRPISPITS